MTYKNRISITKAVLLLLLVESAVPAANITFVDLHPAGAPSSVARGIDAIGEVGTIGSGTSSRAAMWFDSADTFVDLHPPGASSSTALCGGGQNQGGAALVDGSPPISHAVLWTGAPWSYSDLDPGLNRFGSRVNALNGSQQGGYYSVVIGSSLYSRATLWTGSPASFLDLTPAGSTSGVVYGLSDCQQVGVAKIAGQSHAALWSGSPESFVDLHVEGADSSLARATSGSQQVGQVYIEPTSHAALWTGSAASFVDLTPPGAVSADAYGVSKGRQVGFATINGSDHAILWSGMATSFVDLQTALGGAYTRSYAYAIWTDDNRIRVVGCAYTASSPSVCHAILWIIPNTPSVQIQMQRVGVKLVPTLMWTNNGVSCELQSSSAAGDWKTVLARPFTNDNHVSVAVTNAAAAQFFRLHAK